MKTTIDIPQDALSDVIKFTGAKTKREAILIAVREYNRRQRMARLTRFLGTCKELMSVEELEKLRKED
jgi:Arc/MetJ family transcription regulator